MSQMDDLIFSDPQLEIEVKEHSKKILSHPYQNWENKWFLAQYKEDFRQEHSPPMEVRYINEEKGRGVFALQDIPRNTYICPYVGLVRPRELEKDKENGYIFDYPCKTVIDAEKTDHICRFFNHDDEPNLTAQWLVVDDLFRIFFYSHQNITKDEELTFNYGPNFWKNLTKNQV